MVILTSYKLLTNKYKAIYITSEYSQMLSLEECKKENILIVNTFNDMQQKIDTLSYKVGILIDKSILSENNNLKNYNKWLLEQKGYPIVALGYGKSVYVYFYKFEFATGYNKPILSKKNIEDYQKQAGLSLAYICSDGKILGKGYKDSSMNTIINILAMCSKDERYVKKVFENN